MNNNVAPNNMLVGDTFAHQNCKRTYSTPNKN
jgi:hypothetical protein